MQPTPLADSTTGDPIALKRWQLELKKHDEQSRGVQRNLAYLFSVVLGQCTEALADKIKSHIDYVGANQNGILLLCIIKQLSYSFED